MRLRVCVSDYRFMTLFFFFPLRMWTAAALVIFTTCFTVLLTRGRPSFCGKCIFYVVIECICIRGLVLKNGSVLRKRAHKSTPWGSRSSARELAVTYLQLSRVKHTNAHKHTHTTLWTIHVYCATYSNKRCFLLNSISGTHLFVFFNPSLALM